MRVFRLFVYAAIVTLLVPATFAATTFTVNDNGDQGDGNTTTDPGCGTTLGPPGTGGPCTLRAALQQAAFTGSSGAPYTINFSAPMTITVGSTVLDIREQTILDGTSVGKVILDGNGLSGNLTLSFNSGGSTIKGFIIHNFSSDGIDISTNGNFIQQNFIGTDITATSAVPNGGSGIQVSSAGNIIGGPTPADFNVISGNDIFGIDMFSVGAFGNVIQFNFIGTDITGQNALGNGDGGISLSSTTSGDVTVPTLVNAIAVNVISGNGTPVGNGISLNNAIGTLITANYIGVALPPGLAAIPNDGEGIYLSDSDVNIIGGITIGDRNVVSGNTEDGIQITSGSSFNVINGNFIGLDSIGVGAVPNGRDGVFLNASDNIISGIFITAPQHIAGNTRNGVTVQSTSNNQIIGNNIGENLGDTAVANGADGVQVAGGGTGNLISKNDITASGVAINDLGIDLVGTNGPDLTENTDPLDPDTGSNNLQNRPVLLTAVTNAGTTTVNGELHSLPNTTLTVEFFSNSVCDTSGFGEGEDFDSSQSVGTDAAGNATFSFALSNNLAPGQLVTATATETSANNTSEFSNCAAVVVIQADLAVTKTDSPDPVDAGTNITYTITLHNNGPDDAQNVSLTDATPPNTTFVSFTSAPGYSCTTPAVGGIGTISCTNATVLNGANDVFTLVVKVNSNVAAGTTITNNATASSTTGDSVAGNNTGSATTIVAISSDLSITKTDAPDPVDAGSNLTYTIQVTNNGPSDATIVQISDVVPANTTFVSSTTPAGFSCTTPIVGGTGPVTCNATSALAAGAVTTVTMVVNVNASTVPPATITNTATVSSPTDTNGANDSATATTTVTATADLSITKTDAPDPVTAGNNVTYTVTVTNNGPSDAAGVQISDPLPANTTFVSNTPSGNITCTTPAVGTNGTVDCTATGPLAPSATATTTIVAKVAASVANGATLSNTATATTTTTDPTVNTATATTTVAASADLSVTKVDTPDPVAPGGNITYTLTIANGGPSDAQTISVTDATPANTTFVSVTAPAYSCTSPAVGGTGPITCTLATLAASANNQITIVVNVNPATPNATVITNSATATTATADPAPANNTGTTTTTVSSVVLSADLSLTKADAPDPVTAGTNLTYTIQLSNAGPDPASTVVLTDALPAGTTFVSLANPVAYTCATPAVGANGTITCTNPSVPMGGPDTFTVVVATDPASGNGSTISNTATVSTTTTDPNNANNSATATTTVATSADIAITKSDSPDPVAAGTNITYTITATNNGPSDAAGVSINDTTPANTTFVSATPAAGFSCTTPAVGGTGAISCGGGNILTGTAPTFQIVVNVNAATPNATIISNSATFTSATTDPNPANDTGTATTTVTAAATSADLSLTKTGSPDPVAAGANITYTIAVTNGGPNDATTVALTDTVPANTTFVSLVSAVGYTCTTPAVGGTGTVTCTIPTVLNTTVSTFTLTVQVGAAVANGTIITNTAAVSTATSDPTPGNNSATATTTVTNVVASADVSVSKSGLPNPVNPGANITYTVTVFNAGPSAAANVILTDATPANTTFVSAAMPAGYTCTTPVVGGTGTITCTNVSLASGATGNFTFVVQVGAATPNGTIITNTANVSTTSSDPTPGNNTATANTTVTVPVGTADLSITKTDSPDPVALGGIVTYTITVQNNGPNTATGVIVTDTLPAGASFSSASAGCTNSAGTVTCNLNSVLNAGSATVTIQAIATLGPTLTNTAQVTSNQTDPNLANNSSTATTTVSVSANVPTASPFTLLLLAMTLAAAGWFVSRK